MILLDPDLGPDLGTSPRPNGNQLNELNLRRGQGSMRRSHAPSPKSNWGRAPLPWAQRLPTPATLNRFLREAQQAIRLRGQVSVLLTSDKAIRKLNRQFRGKNKTTDVLSFPAAKLIHNEKNAGDLAISIDTARKQAAQQGHALTCELKILMLHGLLHLAGYDHETDAGRMARREAALRAKFGLPLGLIERAKSGTASRPAAPERQRGERVSKPARKSARSATRRPAP